MYNIIIADQRQQTPTGKTLKKPNVVSIAVHRCLLVQCELSFIILSEKLVLVSIYLLYFWEHHERGHCSRSFRSQTGNVTPTMREGWPWLLRYVELARLWLSQDLDENSREGNEYSEKHLIPFI